MESRYSIEELHDVAQYLNENGYRVKHSIYPNELKVNDHYYTKQELSEIVRLLTWFGKDVCHAGNDILSYGLMNWLSKTTGLATPNFTVGSVIVLNSTNREYARCYYAQDHLYGFIFDNVIPGYTAHFEYVDSDNVRLVESTDYIDSIVMSYIPKEYHKYLIQGWQYPEVDDFLENICLVTMSSSHHDPYIIKKNGKDFRSTLDIFYIDENEEKTRAQLGVEYGIRPCFTLAM